jgi:hypothetical protein
MQALNRNIERVFNLIAKTRVGDAASYARSITALLVRNGNRRQCLKLPAIASRSCLGKRYSATLATKSTACFRSAVDRPQGLGRTRVGTPMVQSMIFGIVLYLTPSVLLLALLTCREEFDYRPDRVASGQPVLSRG